MLCSKDSPVDLSANTPDPDFEDAMSRPHAPNGPTSDPTIGPPEAPVAPPTGQGAHELALDELESHELEGPEPPLEPAAEAHVRALLAAAPDPGPMPAELAGRIETVLADEARLRVDPAPARATDPDQAVLVPLVRRHQRPRPLLAVAAVAAAAAVVVVGASSLRLAQRPDVTALLGGSSSPVPTASATPDHADAPGDDPALHIQLSETAYDAANLPRLARELLASPGAPIGDLAAESPYIGPIATEIGMTACLDALGIPTKEPVHADLAFFEGAPAVVIVASSTDGDTAWVVRRSCMRGDAAVIRGATPVP